MLGVLQNKTDLLGLLEVAIELASRQGEPRLTKAVVSELGAHRTLLYDRAGEEHYNVISALHKSIRNSDADAGLQWLARMLEAGEDPLYVARRLVRFASEDVGLADPQALVIAMAAQQAVHFVGLPEGALALAELVVYLAAPPKSNAVYAAYGEASRDALETRAEPVPLWIRNAPTGLMKDLGYGRGYRYAHDEAEGVAGQCVLSDKAAAKAKALGYSNILTYPEGYPEWEKLHAAPAAAPAEAAAAAPAAKPTASLEPGKEKGSVSVASFEKVMKESPDSILVVDVRDEKEFKQAAIKGSVNIPIAQLEKKMDTLPKGKPIVFVCGTGGRAGESYDSVKLLRSDLQPWFIDAETTFNADGSFSIKAK